MQRKKTRDSYINHVELGSTSLPVVKMRKFGMKRILKICVVVIIGYIIYSVYQKHNMVPSPRDDGGSIYDVPNIDEPIVRADVDQKVVDPPDDDYGERRLKQQINKVFEEFKQKQEERKMQNENMQQPDNNNIANEGIDIANDKGNKPVAIDDQDVADVANELFGNDGQPDVQDDKDNIEEEFEEFNEEEEKQEREIEREIEERLAGVLGDAVKEAKAADEEKIAEAVEEIKREQENKNNAPEMPKEEVVPKNIELKKIIEHLEFEAAVDKMGKRLHPLEVQRMNADARKQALRRDSDHEFPPLVSAVRQTTMVQVKQLISSVHHHLPGRKIYIYSLDLTDDQKKEIIAICGVRLKHFLIGIFPDFVKNLDNLHWKPLVMQSALAEFGHMIWINPGFVLASSEIAPLVHESHEKGVLAVGPTSSYTTFSATHPDMLNFISTDRDKLAKEPHVEIRAIFMHNTQEVHDNIMKVFTACALETSCLAPPGSKWTCKFDFTGRKHADCHRYDESALNILLKNYFNFQTMLFTRRNNYFRPYSKDYRPRLKQCRSISDIKNSEL